MATTGGPSEFGGKQQRNGVQPPPHRPTSSEALMLGYTTGDETGASARNSVAFEGLNPRDVQEALRRQAGDLDKGQVWDEMVAEAGS
jgi:hypothetical protein